MDWLHCVPTQRRDPQRTWTSCICCDDCKAGWQEREDQLRAQNAKSCSQERDQRKKAEPEDPFSSSQVKELKSFFDNGVWTFQSTKEADPGRTLTSRILLKWAKNADGTPRAKARLVVRGYADADALAGELDTASPASTRLGRACLLSMSAILGWCGWSADVSTVSFKDSHRRDDCG